MRQDQQSVANRITASLLLFCFLLQPVVVYFATPAIAIDVSTGTAMVACTLKHEMMSHTPEASPLDEQLIKDEYCPAIKLLDMANAVVHVHIAVIRAHRFNHAYDKFSRPQVAAIATPAYSIRAPPVFS